MRVSFVSEDNITLAVESDGAGTGSELSRYLGLRLEIFNAWNHTQFNDFNRGATFDSTGRLINLPSSRGGGGGTYGFGALTGVRDPRIIQLAAKIYF